MSNEIIFLCNTVLLIFGAFLIDSTYKKLLTKKGA